MIPEMKWITKGRESADSIVINPHKWMFTPLDLSIYFTKKPEILKQVFSLVSEELNNLNEKFLDKINASGKIFLSHTKLNGKFVIRLTIGSIRHERRHIEEAWKIIKANRTQI
ncbi:MAG: hypothetical protein BWY38_02877 [Ignavibacteria bacterium ADurb.Bin266]|jgi:glutamate/tyrosine decarboxylase-like PLP-dependent enzyme|nr:MAG: hypothetical protein BWY38_02877 [Ignavibacteria bacterium ADurb.Bin266]